MNIGTHYHGMQMQKSYFFDTLYVEYGNEYIEYGIRLSLQCHANTKCMFNIKYTLVTLFVSET